jgi:RNA polymerase sigma-70 factor (ECF subfamily)
MPVPEDPLRPFVLQAQSGDAAGFDEIVRRVRDRLLATAACLSRDSHGADDLVQETLADAWRIIGSFDFRCLFTTWLHGMLRFRHLRWVRDRKRHGPWEGNAWETEPAGVDDGPKAPDELLVAEETRERLRNLVARLPEVHRQTVELRFFARHDLQEMAAAMDVPLGTVKSRLHHALEKLRNLYEA